MELKSCERFDAHSGWYRQCLRYQVVRMKELVHEIDHLAYITISEVADVFSNNNK